MASSTQKSQITVTGASAPAPAAAKGKGKKGGKQAGGLAAAQKKPGRGMGVAQLERMRIQESWKLITDLNPVPLQTGFGVQGMAPIRCGELHELSGGLYSIHPQAFVQPGPTGLITRPTAYFARPGSFQVDSGSAYCGPSDHNRVRVLGGLNGGGFRPELPSIPNVDSGSWGDFDFNSFTSKKKRAMNGEDLEGFVGVTRENMCYQGAEILAVHRKGVGRRNMVMEYGFFPANSSSSRAGVTSSSSASTSEYANNNYPYTNSIDLSLRL